MLRAIFSVTFVAALGARAVAAGPVSEAVPVPGGTVALARAIGLETPPEPSRFFAEMARLTYGPPGGNSVSDSSLLRRLTAHLDVAARFRAALEALPNNSPTLALAAGERAGRDQLSAFLELINLRLTQRRGIYSVEGADDREAATQAQMLSALGVDLERLPARLNAGEAVQLRLPTELVPVPLTAALWSEAVFHRPVSLSDLFAAILAEPGASLLGHGLAGLDEETLQYMADHPALLARLSGEVAPVFATFASNLHVRDGRVVPPGGPAALSLWESVVGEKVGAPEAFIRALLLRDSGHLAYLYDLVAELDGPRGAFALGLWVPSERDRIERFKSLAATVHSALTEWQVRENPFSRPLDDIAWMLLNVTVEANGAPRGPATLSLWTQVFDGLDVPDEATARRAVTSVENDGPFDAASLAGAVLTGDPQQRGRRLQQLAFGLRAFSTARPDTFGGVLTAVRALPAYAALMLTVERMGITEPAVFAAAARTAHRLSDLDGAAAFIALSQFQGAIALLSRMTAAGTLEPARAGSLIASLAGIPLKENRYGALVVQWLRGQLLPALTPRQDVEETLLVALAGGAARREGDTGRVRWEGEEYRLDLPASEVRRLRAVRQLQRPHSVETALSLDEVARSLGAPDVDVSRIEAAIVTLRALLPALSPSTASAVKLAGVDDLPDAAAVVDRAVRDLAKITRPNDAKRAQRLAEPLRDLSGVILGKALSSIAYALDLGEASEGSLVGGDLSRRHDFGLGLKDKSDRRQTGWSIPRQVVEVGRPRHVLGSLMGLDIAFAKVLLRRVIMDDVAPGPVLLSNDRDTFTKSIALLNPYGMRDADRDAIAAAISKGRARIDAMVTSPAPNQALGVVAAEIKLDGWRRRAAQWEIVHDPGRVPLLFSLTELLVLGAEPTARLSGWGMADTPLSGCLCTRVAATNEWRIVSGRPQIGAMGMAVPDVNLHVAVMLATLQLPAPLARMVVGAAMQEYLNSVRPNDANDWLTLVRGAAQTSRQRIEDYVAAATADGPLLLEKSYQEQQP
jgi:hypothetical protein